ncbi:hypothetical protein G7043_15875 [Lentzea sp. NEAU-D13]|uniref:Uncharacterized protein n=1 Tax=Lentzea alba TaxID=2714351 RepID=A0A7C9RQZ5_9PSEU|nr:hypothetical protein [Lentzea alba]NGY60407.1 hypothetical protein [Lentzea alba]
MPHFGPEIDAYSPYQPQTTCEASAKPGPIAVHDLLNATYGTHTAGISRNCNGTTSEHHEGRALDCHFNADDLVHRRAGGGRRGRRPPCRCGTGTRRSSPAAPTAACGTSGPVLDHLAEAHNVLGPAGREHHETALALATRIEYRREIDRARAGRSVAS